ncbi:hypothetical protein [Moorena producens]|uniref:hypothetical protein n=1 Tax=Moorena producens TaxID=1155739 RepID=UPI003C7759FE
MTTVGRSIAFMILFASILLPNSRFPIPDSRLPIPDSRLPIPDSPLPIPDSPQLPRSLIPKHQEIRPMELYLVLDSQKTHYDETS